MDFMKGVSTVSKGAKVGQYKRRQFEGLGCSDSIGWGFPFLPVFYEKWLREIWWFENILIKVNIKEVGMRNKQEGGSGGTKTCCRQRIGSEACFRSLINIIWK
jgi:hypothetical protein